MESVEDLRQRGLALLPVELMRFRVYSRLALLRWLFVAGRIGGATDGAG